MEGVAAELRQYLLGSLTAEETEVLDLKVLSEEAFADEISLAESELIEDYLEGGLSEDERKLFDIHFLSSPRRESELRDIAYLKTNLGRIGQLPIEENLKTEGFLRRITRVLPFNLRPLTFGIAGVAAVLVIVGFFWFAGSRGSALETEYAELNKQDLTRLDQFGTPAQVNLASETFRRGGQLGSHSRDTLTDRVLFRLGIAAAREPRAKFKASVFRENTLIFSVSEVSVYQNPNGQEIRLLLPGSLFEKGPYQIRIREQPSGKEETFVFVVD